MLTKSLAFNFGKISRPSGDIETNGSMIILLFPSLISISNQSIVNQNYIENEALVSAVDFRVQSAVSWERSITPCNKGLQCGKYILLHQFIVRYPSATQPTVPFRVGHKGIDLWNAVLKGEPKKVEGLLKKAADITFMKENKSILTMVRELETSHQSSGDAIKIQYFRYIKNLVESQLNSSVSHYNSSFLGLYD